MPILGALALILQIGLCVHCVKTGRDRQWLFLIIMVPLLGSAVYFFSQVLPDMQNNRTVRRAVGGLGRAVDPEGELQRRKVGHASLTIDMRKPTAEKLTTLKKSHESQMANLAQAIPEFSKIQVQDLSLR